jgi:hypothetical protein
MSYTFGKRLDWDINFRFNLASGFPVTRKQGNFNNIDFSGGVTTNYVTDNTANLGTLYGPINQGRLPYYNRLDISVKKKIIISENSVIEINVGCTNAYNRKNLFYVNRITNDKEYQLPLMPTVGANWTF